MSEEEKKRGIVIDHDHQQPQYGTFQGVASHPPPPQQPAIGFPQPVPPPGSSDPAALPPRPPQHQPHYYAHGYQSVPGYTVAEGRPISERRLPCCGIGFGWCMFIIGFFLGAIPWYVGALIFLCGRIDRRERPGYIACLVAAIIAAVAIILGVTKGVHDW